MLSNLERIAILVFLIISGISLNAVPVLGDDDCGDGDHHKPSISIQDQNDNSHVGDSITTSGCGFSNTSQVTQVMLGSGGAISHGLPITIPSLSLTQIPVQFVIAIFLTTLILVIIILTTRQRGPKPVLTYVKVPKDAETRRPLEIEACITNEKGHAEVETLSLAFPCLNSTSSMYVKNTNFDSTRLVNFGDKTYSREEIATYARYPSVEFDAKSVRKGDMLSVTLQVRPYKTGSFVIYAKVIARNKNKTVRFPAAGTVSDYANDFIRTYTVSVKEEQAAYQITAKAEPEVYHVLPLAERSTATDDDNEYRSILEEIEKTMQELKRARQELEERRTDLGKTKKEIEELRQSV